MNLNVTPPRSPHCAAVADGLSWYAIDTLGAAERADVDAHLQGCAACRAELAVERRIVESMRAPRDNVEQSPHAGWQKMLARLDAHDATAASVGGTEARSTTVTSGATASPVPQARKRRVNWPVALGVAVAVQAAAIAVLALALVRHREKEPNMRLYHTVANGDATLAVQAPLVRIAFDSTIDQAIARTIAAEAQGQILTGPSPENVYTFVFPKEMTAGDTLDEKVDVLRRRAHVLLVEPVVLSEQPRRE